MAGAAGWGAGVLPPPLAPVRPPLVPPEDPALTGGAVVAGGAVADGELPASELSLPVLWSAWLDCEELSTAPGFGTCCAAASAAARAASSARVRSAASLAASALRTASSLSRCASTSRNGEGKFNLPLTEDQYNIVAKYGYDAYPSNPNGSDYNTAMLCDKTGRHLVTMPHIERSTFQWNWANYPAGRKDEVSPWLDAFVNAREWIEKLD